MGLRDLFRVSSKPSGADTGRMVSLSPTIPLPDDVRPIEGAVIDIISSLASRVRIESDIPVMQQPDKSMSRRGWLRYLAWHAVIDGLFSIVAVKYAGRDDQYLVFPDSDKPMKISDSASEYHYSRKDVQYRVKEKDILQFRYRYIESSAIRVVREAEDAFWTRYRKMGVNTGFMHSDPTKMGVTQRETAQEVDAEFMRMLKQSDVARLPTGQQFTHLQSGEDIEKAFEAITRAWCYTYKLPTSLLNLDLPSHSTVTISASYGNFIRQCLGPMLEDVMEALSIRNRKPITLDFSGVEKGGVLENSDHIMKLSQTGVLTINEIRALEKYGPRPDGDTYPNVAGAPTTDKGNGDNND